MVLLPHCMVFVCGKGNHMYFVVMLKWLVANISSMEMQGMKDMPLTITCVLHYNQWGVVIQTLLQLRFPRYPSWVGCSK